MAGFTEGFSDTRGYRDHIGSVISKVLVARQMAEKERAHAEAIAETQDTSLAEAGIERGYFFKKALGFEFGGQFYDEKKAQVKNIIDKRKLLKDPRGLTEELKKALKNKFKQRIGADKTLKFRGHFNYTIDKPLDTLVPTTVEKTAEAASGKKTSDKISREDLLSTITGLTQSLEQTAQSINKNIGDNSTIASAIATSQSSIVNEISHRTTGIEDKLDAIAAAINEQTALGKEQVDKKEDKISERRSEKQLDLFDTQRLDNPETKGLDESLLKSAGDEQDLMDAIPDPWEGGPMDGEPKQNIYPDMEQGGIIEGPDSGYWFRAHGREMITPLDNNFTQGEPSAVDGITRRPPMFEKGSYEIGTSPRQDHIGRTAFTPLNLPNLNSSGGGFTEKAPTTGYTQPMVDLMTFPVMLTGGSILSSTSELISRLSPDSAAIASDIQRLSKPVANLFGLPDSMVSSVVAKTQLTANNDRKRRNEDEISPVKTKKKGLMDRLFNWWKNLTGGGDDDDPSTPPSSSSPTPTNLATGKADNVLAAYLSALEGGSGQNAADAMQVMLNRDAGEHTGRGYNLGDEIMAEGQFTPFSVAIHGPGLDKNANRAYKHVTDRLGNSPEERKAALRHIAETEGFAGLDKLFGKSSGSSASAILQDFQQGGPMSESARKGVKGRAYFKGQADIENKKSGDFYRGTGGNYFHDHRDINQLPVGKFRGKSLDTSLKPSENNITPLPLKPVSNDGALTTQTILTANKSASQNFTLPQESGAGQGVLASGTAMDTGVYYNANGVVS